MKFSIISNDYEIVNDDENGATCPGLDSNLAKKRKTSTPRLLDGKYFEIVAQNDTKIEAKCMTCGKHRKGDIRSTGNFMDHYTTAHPTLINEVELHKKGKNDVTSLKQTTIFPKAQPLCTHAVSFQSYYFRFFVIMNRYNQKLCFVMIFSY